MHFSFLLVCLVQYLGHILKSYSLSKIQICLGILYVSWQPTSKVPLEFPEGQLSLLVDGG